VDEESELDIWLKGQAPQKHSQLKKKVSYLCTTTHNLHFDAVILAYPPMSGSNKEQCAL